VYLRELLREDLNHNERGAKETLMREELDKKCRCEENLMVCGSPSVGFFTQCKCGEVGYFDDNEGRKLYYQ
jgi:hypothetical protein